MHDEGEVVAYAVWPSRDTWVEARKLPSANPEAETKMRECIEESFPSVTLDVRDDLLGRA